MDENLLNDLRASIMKVLEKDGRPMSLNLLMHKVFKDIQPSYPSTYIRHQDFSLALSELLKKYWVGRNKFNKYFIDYLDYEETGIEGHGYIEVDVFTGNGYITVKKEFKEYKKASHFVHKKNLNGAKCGDYVRFAELKNTKAQSDKFDHKDAVVKEILPRPSFI